MLFVILLEKKVTLVFIIWTSSINIAGAEKKAKLLFISVFSIKIEEFFNRKDSKTGLKIAKLSLLINPIKSIAVPVTPVLFSKIAPLTIRLCRKINYIFSKEPRRLK